jgi:OmpA-OmpF porin, OOP family
MLETSTNTPSPVMTADVGPAITVVGSGVAPTRSAAHPCQRAESARGRVRVAALAAAALIAALTPPTSAAAASNLSVGRFEPSPAGDPFFGVASAEVTDDASVRTRLTFDYAHDPLVFHSSNGQTLAPIIDAQLFATIGASIALWQRFSISLDVPVALVQSGPSPVLGSASATSPSGAHVGDVRLGGRVPLLRNWRDVATFAVAAYVWMPLGSSDSKSGVYASDGQFRGRVDLLVGHEGERLVWSAALGPDLRRSQTYLGVRQGTMIHLGGGVGWRFLDSRSLLLGGELETGILAAQPSAYNTNAEARLVARYQTSMGLEVGLGAGPGLTSGIGTPDYRVIGTLSYAAGHEPPVVAVEPVTPAPAVVEPTPAPPVACPGHASLTAATLEACPPPPVACAGQPEVTAPTLAECPPPDRDGDGVPDAADACPDVKGVATSEPATNGCPGDRDGDHVTDDVDACPDEPGKVSPDPRKNGCPTGAVVGDQIVLLEQVKFALDSDRILPASDAILRLVLDAIRTLPEGTRLRVEGHTDTSGPADHNRDLSLRRARSVVQWMSAHGVAADRFDTAGFGPDRPIADNKQESGRSLNRRVEFHIIVAKGE